MRPRARAVPDSALSWATELRGMHVRAREPRLHARRVQRHVKNARTRRQKRMRQLEIAARRSEARTHPRIPSIRRGDAESDGETTNYVYTSTLLARSVGTELETLEA